MENFDNDNLPSQVVSLVEALASETHSNILSDDNEAALDTIFTPVSSPRAYFSSNFLEQLPRDLPDLMAPSSGSVSGVNPPPGFSLPSSISIAPAVAAVVVVDGSTTPYFAPVSPSVYTG